MTNVSTIYSMDPKSFVPGSGVNVTKAFDQGQTQEADYSPNLVAIEISGPGLASLSFFDLPGLFSHANVPEEKYLVTAFENLAKQYINHKNALVISAMAMDTDAGNSKTSAFVEECKAEARCVRVLTKPDRLQDGGDSILDFDKLLRGQAHFLPRGYFVTKQPGPNFKLRDGAEYHAQAREEEAAFFDEDPRWTTEWQEFRHRCGTDAFVKSISQMLANQIADRYEPLLLSKTLSDFLAWVTYKRRSTLSEKMLILHLVLCQNSLAAMSSTSSWTVYKRLATA